MRTSARFASKEVVLNVYIYICVYHIRMSSLFQMPLIFIYVVSECKMLSHHSNDFIEVFRGSAQTTKAQLKVYIICPYMRPTYIYTHVQLHFCSSELFPQALVASSFWALSVCPLRELFLRACDLELSLHKSRTHGLELIPSFSHKPLIVSSLLTLHLWPQACPELFP